ANYQILPGKEKVVTELRSLASNAEHIYLATDLDREGEAIAWHLREVIGGDNQRFSRVVFNEITKNAIKQAFDNPGKINIDRVNAQQARRFLDRVVGYMVSPLLWKKISRGLSAGRVQSVVVRLIVEREREIKAFMPQE
ncbi:MAG: DNA topoisomerase, partial [Arsenophonus sp. NC-QC1-MAG3]